MHHTNECGRRQGPSWLTPTHNLLGTLRQSIDAIDLFLSDPTRRVDRDGAWALAWHEAVLLPTEVST